MPWGPEMNLLCRLVIVLVDGGVTSVEIMVEPLESFLSMNPDDEY